MDFDQNKSVTGFKIVFRSLLRKTIIIIFWCHNLSKARFINNLN